MGLVYPDDDVFFVPANYPTSYGGTQCRTDEDSTPQPPTTNSPIQYRFDDNNGTYSKEIEKTDKHKRELESKIRSNYTEAWKKGTKYDPNSKKNRR